MKSNYQGGLFQHKRARQSTLKKANAEGGSHYQVLQQERVGRENKKGAGIGGEGVLANLW